MFAGANKQISSYLGYFLCFLFFSITVLAFYPGMMTQDSIGNLLDARAGTFRDINSPVMALLWRQLDFLVAGPGLLFILQNVIFWGACLLFWHSTRQRSFWLGLSLIVFVVMPQILSQIIVVWKDIGLGASLFFAVALIYYAKTKNARIALLLSPLFLLYAYAARLNAAPAILPVALWSAFIAFQVFEIKASKLFSLGAGLGYFFALTIVVYLTINTLTGWQTVYPFQQIYLYDLAAISAEKNEIIFPDFVASEPEFSFEALKTKYTPYSVNPMLYPDVPNKGDRPIFHYYETAAEVSALRQKWLEAIYNNPTIYLRHRMNVFAQLIGLNRSTMIPLVEFDSIYSIAEFQPEKNAVNGVVMQYFRAFRRPLPHSFFRAAIWMILCAFFLYKAVRYRLRDDWDLVLVLSTSVLLFILAYFPTAPSTEYRYLFWPAVATPLTVIFGSYLLIKQRREKYLRSYEAKN